MCRDQKDRMPLYDYGCKSKECGHKWETSHKLAEPGPQECPLCGCVDVGRLISAVHGSVTLSGRDLKAKIKEDARKISKEAQTSDRLLANLVGENKFQANVLAVDKARKEFGKD
jgi:putative FmdB family regulatory protein